MLVYEKIHQVKVTSKMVSDQMRNNDVLDYGLIRWPTDEGNLLYKNSGVLVI